MGTVNRYTPKFKADAIARFRARRAGNSAESKARSLQIIAAEMDVPESTVAGWVRGVPQSFSEGISESLAPQPEPEKTPRRERPHLLDKLAFIVSLAALAVPLLGVPTLRDQQEKYKNAQSYVEAVTGASPASYGALATRYAAALNYTEQDSPASRVLTLLAEAARVSQRINETVEAKKGRAVTRVDGEYRACAIDEPSNCRHYSALDFDERNRLRSYSLDGVPLESMLLNREEGSSQNDHWKVSVIEGFEAGGQVVFVAQVTNQRADEVASMDFAGAHYAAGDQHLPASVEGPSTLGANESVTITGLINHGRGVTLTVQMTYQDESHKNPAETVDLLIKLV
jgi:transposase-like protein